MNWPKLQIGAEPDWKQSKAEKNVVKGKPCKLHGAKLLTQVPVAATLPVHSDWFHRPNNWFSVMTDDTKVA